MPLIIPTISRLQTATTCNASVVLEQIPQGPQSASAKRGTLLGSWVAASLRGWPMPDLGRYKVDWNIDELRTYLGDGHITCEEAFSWDGDTAMPLGENLNRNYGGTSTVCGAADIIVHRPHALVADLKSGTYPVPDARDNWQLAALAMMAADAHRFETVTGVVIHMERGGTWRFGERHTWDGPQLKTIALRLTSKMREWEEAQSLYDAGLADPERVQNAGCFFCRTACEYGRNAQREAA